MSQDKNRDPELDQWLKSLQDEGAPTDLEMARWKKAVNAQAAKSAPPVVTRPFIRSFIFELSKVAAALVIGFVGGAYSLEKYQESRDQTLYQVDSSQIREEVVAKGADESAAMGGSGPVRKIGRPEGSIADSISTPVAQTLDAAMTKAEAYPPLVGQSVRIAEAKGNRVWASGLNLDSEFLGITTAQGTLVLSTFPFKGSMEVGVLEGKSTTIRLPHVAELRMTSETAFLPPTKKVKLYGLFAASVRTAKNQAQIFEAATEDRILSRLKSEETSGGRVLGQ